MHVMHATIGQGLSHYLEHMLFMGSEAFPDENEFDAFLTAHGGASNACTENVSGTYKKSEHERVLFAFVAHRMDPRALARKEQEPVLFMEYYFFARRNISQ